MIAKEPKIFVLGLLLFVCAALNSAESGGTSAPLTYFPPPDNSGGWRTATNTAQIRDLGGMDLPKLEHAWVFTQRCTQNGGLVVAHNGWLVFEKYFGRASRDANPDMASTGKAYTSIACGIMFKEFHDKIPEGLDTKVFTPKFLPEAFSSDGKLDDPHREEISLGELLCMTGGYWRGWRADSRSHGQGVSTEARAWTEYSRPGPVIPALRDVDECRRGLFVFIA